MASVTYSVSDIFYNAGNSLLKSIEKFQNSVDDIRTVLIRPIDFIAQYSTFYGKPTVLGLMANQCSGYFNLIELVSRVKNLCSVSDLCSNFYFIGDVSTQEGTKWSIPVSNSDSKEGFIEKIFHQAVSYASFFDRLYGSVNFVSAFYRKKFTFWGVSAALTTFRVVEPLYATLSEGCKLWNNRDRLPVGENKTALIEMTKDEKISCMLHLAFNISWLAMAILGVISLTGIAIPCAVGLKLSLFASATLLGIASYVWDNGVVEKRIFKKEVVAGS